MEATSEFERLSTQIDHLFELIALCKSDLAYREYLGNPPDYKYPLMQPEIDFLPEVSDVHIFKWSSEIEQLRAARKGLKQNPYQLLKVKRSDSFNGLIRKYVGDQRANRLRKMKRLDVKIDRRQERIKKTLAAGMLPEYLGLADLLVEKAYEEDCHLRCEAAYKTTVDNLQNRFIRGLLFLFGQ